MKGEKSQPKIRFVSPRFRIVVPFSFPLHTLLLETLCAFMYKHLESQLSDCPLSSSVRYYLFIVSIFLCNVARL